MSFEAEIVWNNLVEIKTQYNKYEDVQNGHTHAGTHSVVNNFLIQSFPLDSHSVWFDQQEDVASKNHTSVRWNGGTGLFTVGYILICQKEVNHVLS